MDPLTTVSSAIMTAKKLYEIAKKVKDAEVRELIADLRNQLADLKTEIADLKSENQRLSEAVNRKKQFVNFREKFERKCGMYFLTVDAEGHKKGTPFCPRCFDVDNRLVSPSRVNSQYHLCPHCKAVLS